MSNQSTARNAARRAALFTLAALLSVPLPGSVLGAPGAPGVGQKALALADRDHDGALTRAEACAGKTPRICKRFHLMDRNHDGVVTRAEIRAYQQAKRVTRPPGAPGPRR